MKTTEKMPLMKKERLLNELSWTALSKRTGVGWHMIKKAELEPKNVPVSTLERIAKFFGYKATEMFEIE